MEHIGAQLEKREKTIELVSNDPLAREGFTQVPNFVLRAEDLSLGEKVTYSLFLSYAWYNDCVFPGQDRLAKDMGVSRSRATEFVSGLRKKGYLEITRRGLGKTNIYRLHFRVTTKKDRENKGSTS